MKDETYKRMAGDYGIIQSIHIGDRQIGPGEKPQDESAEKYMYAKAKRRHDERWMFVSIKDMSSRIPVM